MDEVSRRQGRTVLFVSHNMGAVSSLCRSVIWIDSGMIRRSGAPKNVIGEYLVHGKPSADRHIDLSSIPRHRDSDDRLRLESIEWLCDLPLRHGEPLKARINFRTRAALTDVAIGIGFSNMGGTRLLSYDTDFQEGSRQTLPRPGRYSVRVEVDSLSLGPDMYCLDIGCRSGDSHSLDYLAAVAQVEIVAGPKTPGYLMRGSAGVRLAGHWTWQGLNEEQKTRLSAV
jgi:lipopolysaccharide transport system ATP-binding protein